MGNYSKRLTNNQSWANKRYGTYSTPCGCAWYRFMDDREYPYDNGVA